MHCSCIVFLSSLEPILEEIHGQINIVPVTDGVGGCLVFGDDSG